MRQRIVTHPSRTARGDPPYAGCIGGNRPATCTDTRLQHQLGGVVVPAPDSRAIYVTASYDAGAISRYDRMTS